MLNITAAWYKNIDQLRLNVSIFLDLKKPLTRSTMTFCYRRYQYLASVGKQIAGSKRT